MGLLCCSSTSETHRLFSFPKNDNLRTLWMSFLVPTNSILIGLSKEQLLRKRVCEKHFDIDQFDEEGKRLRYSYPCLFTDVEIEHGVPLMPSESDRNALSDHNYCKRNSDEDINVTDEILVLGIAGDDIHEHPLYIHEVNMAVKRQGDVTDQPSCSFSKPLDIEIPTLSEHTENEIVKTTERKLSYEIRIKGFKGLAVKTNNFRKTKFVKRLKEITSKRSIIFKNFGCLSKQAQTFLLMQLKLCSKNKMARFNLDEKLTALVLWKQSPKSYRLLETVFALPNKRTLNRLTEKMFIEPGVLEFLNILKTK